MSTQFNCQKHFYFKLFKQLYITIQFNVSTVSLLKTVQFQIIQFSIGTQFRKRLNSCIQHIEETLTGTPGHSDSRSNGNEGEFHITQSTRTKASPLDASCV